jgi:hypothetical protein
MPLAASVSAEQGLSVRAGKAALRRGLVELFQVETARLIRPASIACPFATKSKISSSTNSN